MSTCECTTTTTTQCRSTPGERPRYFPRQLVTAEDLMLEQEYFRNRMRLHNRLLHGWGVVCGLLVSPAPAQTGGMEPWKVRVCPGYAIGPSGDDIFTPCEVDIDVRQDSVSGSSVEPCGGTGDVWCSDVWLDRSRDQVLYLAIRYDEIRSRPVRVQPAGCSCDDSACEFSRFRDGYVIRVLTSTEYRTVATDPSSAPDWRALFPVATPRNPNPRCKPCPENPWVVLASVTLDTTGRITAIDNSGPRRLVAALGNFFWTSAGNMRIEQVTRVTGESARCGGNNALTLQRDRTETLTVTGAGFQDGLTVDFGPGTSVSPIVHNPNWPLSFNVNLTVAADAADGPRDLIIRNTDCTTAICSAIATVPRAPVLTTGNAPAGASAPAEETKTAAKSRVKKR